MTRQKNLHQAVGAIIIKNNKILLIDRAIFPLGFACPAGHIEKRESPKNALIREVKEETNLSISEIVLIEEKILRKNPCNKGSSVHNWFIFSCKAKGKIKKNDESNKVKWVSLKDLPRLKFEYTWHYWLKRLNYLD